MVGSLLFGIGVVSITGFAIYFFISLFRETNMRHENNHARDVRRETEEAPPSFLARRSHARALSILNKKSKRDCSKSYLSPSFFLYLKSKAVTT